MEDEIGIELEKFLNDTEESYKQQKYFEIESLWLNVKQVESLQDIFEKTAKLNEICRDMQNLLEHIISIESLEIRQQYKRITETEIRDRIYAKSQIFAINQKISKIKTKLEFLSYEIQNKITQNHARIHTRF